MKVVELSSVSVRYSVPRERIVSLKEFAIRRIQRRLSYREFWALKAVDLELRQGEVVGVIGRNGAGKSTLLRLIARVMPPTEGRVRVVGSVAPLLDLGAGFHPELTGRENVFLNGTLLGHNRRDVEEHFAEIVAFAQLEEFIDAPLRTYSSGMAARLGFAVATAWKPDILIVDEALSVGDEAFRTRCERRIDAFRNAGTSVLLVSHDLALVRAMCQSVLWLDHGVVCASGAADTVIDQYRRAPSS